MDKTRLFVVIVCWIAGAFLVHLNIPIKPQISSYVIFFVLYSVFFIFLSSVVIFHFEKIKSFLKDNKSQKEAERKTKDIIKRADDYQSGVSEFLYGHDLMADYWKQNIRNARYSDEAEDAKVYVILSATKIEMDEGRNYDGMPIKKGWMTRFDYDEYFAFVDSYGTLEERKVLLERLAALHLLFNLSGKAEGYDATAFEFGVDRLKELDEQTKALPEKTRSIGNRLFGRSLLLDSQPDINTKEEAWNVRV